jgi:hypothetical protein
MVQRICWSNRYPIWILRFLLATDRLDCYAHWKIWKRVLPGRPPSWANSLSPPAVAAKLAGAAGAGEPYGDAVAMTDMNPETRGRCGRLRPH